MIKNLNKGFVFTLLKFSQKNFLRSRNLLTHLRKSFKASDFKNLNKGFVFTLLKFPQKNFLRSRKLLTHLRKS